VDLATGKVRWRLKLGIEQRNSSLLFADGKLYIPMLEDPVVKGSGAFYVIRPGRDSGEILSHIQVAGRCFGTPVAYRGRVYLQTKEKVYCFGNKTEGPMVAGSSQEAWPKAGAAVSLQVIPSEVLLRPGQTANFRVRKLDANGLTVEEVKDVSAVKWASYVPPTARVKAKMDGEFNARGELVVGAKAKPSEGAYEATLDGM